MNGAKCNLRIARANYSFWYCQYRASFRVDLCDLCACAGLHVRDVQCLGCHHRGLTHPSRTYTHFTAFVARPSTCLRCLGSESVGLFVCATSSPQLFVCLFVCLCSQVLVDVSTQQPAKPAHEQNNQTFSDRPHEQTIAQHLIPT